MEEDCDYTVIKNARGKSDLWTHFGFKERKVVNVIEQQVSVCLHCKVTITLAGGTSNMKTHMLWHLGKRTLITRLKLNFVSYKALVGPASSGLFIFISDRTLVDETHIISLLPCLFFTQF